MKLPFEASLEELVGNMDQFVTTVFSSLESDFMTMPRGNGFIEFSAFEKGYEVLKMATKGFTDLRSVVVAKAVADCPLVLSLLGVY